MRKVDKDLDNPIDNMITDVGEEFMPSLKNLGFTPNMLTTYSFVLGLASVYFLQQKRIHNFAICFGLSYVFDCWDGYMARKYKMTSKFGDLYDHITDVTVTVLLLYTVYMNYRHKLTLPLLLIVVIMTILMNMHVGCYQKHYIDSDKSEQETIDSLADMCQNKDDIRWTKYFGPGTYILFSIGVIYYLTKEN